jgi:hypothetical protein
MVPGRLPDGDGARLAQTTLRVWRMTTLRVWRMTTRHAVNA